MPIREDQLNGRIATIIRECVKSATTPPTSEHCTIALDFPDPGSLRKRPVNSLAGPALATVWRIDTR